MQELRLEDILSRVASLANAKTDAAIAAEIGVSPQTLANWKRRKSIPIEELHELAERRDISLDYLLLGKLPGDTPISMSICKEIRKALESRYSPYSGRNIDMFALFLVRYYNQYAHHHDPEERKRSLLLDMLRSRQSGLRGEIAVLRGLLRDREYTNSKKIRAMLDEDEPLLTEIDQILSDEAKLKATIEAVWKQDDTDEPDSDNKAASPGTGTQAETIITQSIKGSDHEIAGRDIVQKSGKRKKK